MNEKMKFLCELVLGSFPWLMFWCVAINETSLFLCLQVITCFGISVLTCRYVGFAVVALLVEINSVFLHLRQVLCMASLAKSTFYRINSMINLGTYVVFRINTLAWMTRWLVLNRDLIPLISYTIGSVGLAIMTVMNIVLFCRLMRSDFMKSSREQEVRKRRRKKCRKRTLPTPTSAPTKSALIAIIPRLGGKSSFHLLTSFL